MPRERAPRLDELGTTGVRLLHFAVLGIEASTRANGGQPDLSDLTEALQWLATNRKSASATAPVTLRPLGIWVTVPEAARQLGLSVAVVRRWAASGRHFPGARKSGRDWALPLDEVESLRRTRAEAA